MKKKICLLIARYYRKLTAMALVLFLLASSVCGCESVLPGTVATQPSLPDSTQPSESNPTQPSEPEPTELPEPVTVYCLDQVVFLDVKNEKQLEHLFAYDENGNLLTRTRVEGRQNPKVVETFRYDERGNLISSPRRGMEDTEVTYTYDEQNRVLTESWYSTYKRDEIYTYDAEGKLIYQESHFRGKATAYETYTYNEAGQILTDFVDYVSEEKPDILTTYEYDDRGNLLSKLSYDDDSLNLIFSYTYDVNGNMVTELQVSMGAYSGSVQRVRTFAYDEKGNLIREEIYASAIQSYPLQSLPVLEITYQYDEQGNLVEKQSRTAENGEETVTTEKWTYDDKGNMLSEESGSHRIEWTYDEWGDILTYRYYTFGTLLYDITYSYTTFQVTPEQAEKILLQQADYLHGALIINK